MKESKQKQASFQRLSKDATMPVFSKKNMTRKQTQIQLKSRQSYCEPQQKFPRNEYMGIKLPILQMSSPYFPHSHLATSIFYGYFILFFMFSSFFVFVYPIINKIHGEDFFGMTVITLVQTNLIWDMISAVLFTILAIIFIQTRNFLFFLPIYVVILGIFAAFVGICWWIVNNYQMYFSDRIFIIILNLAFCTKTTSYVYDKYLIKQYQKIKDQAKEGSKTNQRKQKKEKRIEESMKEKQKDQIFLLQKQNPYIYTAEDYKLWQKYEQEKGLNSLSKKLLFLISPSVIYHNFVIQHTPSLKIHPEYIIGKGLVSFMCVLVNNILIVKFIEPVCANPSDLSLLALTFKLTPLTFYINMTLYHMVMDNFIAAFAEIAKMKNRVYYLDWWNSNTLDQFLEKWCLLITEFTNQFFPKTLSARTKSSIHVFILLTLLVAVFGHSLNLWSIVLFFSVIVSVFLLGSVRQIQNNYLVHFFTMTFTPFIISLEVKYGLFD